MKIVDIKNVPPDPNTGFMPLKVYNPLNEDFTHSWDGIPYTIPAGEVAMFPEFVARHLAKHLAQKIVSTRWLIKINKEAVGQITPDTARAVPIREIQEMIEALLKGRREVFEKIEAMAPEQPKVVVIEKPLTPIEEFAEEVEEKKEEIKAEEPKIATAEEFKCDICQKVFKVKIALAGHKRSHK